ncbi:MAG: glycosyltransferase [Cyanobacteria bacterium P01_A01_bin.45]
MRKLYFLLPGTTKKFACGGLWAELKTMKLMGSCCTTQVVTYRQREDDKLFLDDLLQNQDLDLNDVIFVMCWGFDVADLAKKLTPYNLNSIYHAHSAGYGFRLPSEVPIITVSRNTMGYWGHHSPNSLIYYLPNQIDENFKNFNITRDIDVLVQTRKSSEYLLKQLIPALKQKCQVFVVDSYIEDLPSLFNRAKVYLYDSAEYWSLQGVTEGFGLQPLEALASGCQVFSSLNHGLSDYLDPGFNCYKISGYSQEYDIQRILKVVNNPNPPSIPQEVFAEYRLENIIERSRIILKELNEFFDSKQNYQSDIPNLTKNRFIKLKIQSIYTKLQKKFLKSNFK